jgi:hypothetical protein
MNDRDFENPGDPSSFEWKDAPNPWNEVNLHKSSKTAAWSKIYDKPCPKHPEEYVPSHKYASNDVFYVNKRHECMNCHTNINSDRHIYKCYTPAVAMNIAEGLCTMYKTDEYFVNNHEAYHFANLMSQNPDKCQNHAQLAQLCKQAKDEMYKCDPDYNPWSEVDFHQSSKLNEEIWSDYK